MKVPAVEVEVEGQVMKLVLDTGARLLVPPKTISERAQKNRNGA